eukprot:s5171_g4.t1
MAPSRELKKKPPPPPPPPPPPGKKKPPLLLAHVYAEDLGHWFPDLCCRGRALVLGFANLQLRVQCLSSQGRLPASRRVQAQPTVPLSFLSWRRVIADPNPVATVVFVPVLRVTHLCHESSRHHADGRSGGSGSIGANDIRRIIEITLVDPARVLACRESCFDRRLRCLQRAMSRILQDKRAEESDLQRELSSGPTAHEI